jgi:hypothetical protein
MSFNNWHFKRHSTCKAPETGVAAGNAGVPLPLNAPVAAKARDRQKALALDEQERMAGLLATERLKTRVEVYDPFEAWNKAREEILSRFRRAQNAPLAAVGPIGLIRIPVRV